MSYKKLERKEGSHDIKILEEDYFHVYAIIDIDQNKTISKIEIEIRHEDLKNNIYGLISGYICKKIIDNDSSYYLVIDLKDVGKSGNHNKLIINKLKDDTENIPFGKSNIIFTHIRYDNTESGSCNIDIFGTKFELNPTHKKGSIIIGNP